MSIDFPHAFFAGLRGNKHNHLDTISFGDDSVLFLIITEREIRDNDAVDTTFYTSTAEIFKSELHDRI